MGLFSENSVGTSSPKAGDTENRGQHVINVCEQGFKILLNLRQKHT